MQFATIGYTAANKRYTGLKNQPRRRMLNAPAKQLIAAPKNEEGVLTMLLMNSQGWLLIAAVLAGVSAYTSLVWLVTRRVQDAPVCEESADSA